MALEDAGRFQGAEHTHNVAAFPIVPAASAPRVDKAASGSPRQQDEISPTAETVNEEIFFLD